MASAVLTFRNGRLDTDDDLAASLNLQEGQRLLAVAAGPDRIVLQRETTAPHKSAALPDGDKPNWRNLRGSLSFLSRSPNDALEEDRLDELELENGQSPQRG